jgi:predicted SAM-dependent methyltransferase
VKFMAINFSPPYLEIDRCAMRVLEIGGYPNSQAHLMPFWEGAEILHLNINPESNPDILADAANIPPEHHGQYDGVFASHVLEHFSYWDTLKVLAGWAACLKDGGSLHVVVPSWEWTARQVLSENPSPATYGHSFAGQVNQWDIHFAMFTMRKLRQLFEKIGLNVTNARTGDYKIHVGGKLWDAEQHYIVGVKGAPALKPE